MFSLLSPSAFTLQFRLFLLPMCVSVSVRYTRTGNTSDWWSPPPIQISLKCNWIQSHIHTYIHTQSECIHIFIPFWMFAFTHTHTLKAIVIHLILLHLVSNLPNTHVYHHNKQSQRNGGRAINYKHSVSTLEWHIDFNDTFFVAFQFHAILDYSYTICSVV